MRRLPIVIVFLLLFLVACNAQSDEPIVELPPTETVLPIPSQQPQVTATIRPTSTDLPTFTPTATLTLVPPTPSDTPTPTLTPTVVGIINSVQAINVRSGPAVTFSVITALPAGTGVQVIGQNEDGSWYNIRLLDDGREGWMASSFVRVEDTPTPFPTLTPSPDLTALFLGTPLPPTELVSGRATATPPGQVQTQSADSATTAPESTRSGALPGVPTIDNSNIFLTATALAGGGSSPAQPTQSATDDRSVDVTVTSASNTTTSAVATSTVAPTATRVGRTVRVFAFCDEPDYGFVTQLPVIRAGDNIEIWWSWFASTEQQVIDHIEASNLEISVNGDSIPNPNSYVGDVRPNGPSFEAQWSVPYGPLGSGEYTIAYQVTWDEAIYDGTEFWGPETENPFWQESCTFTIP